MNKKYQKPMTIKEYTKNFKFPDEKSKENDIDKTKRSIILERILKHKKLNPNISYDFSILNKTIENFHNEAKRKEIMKKLKKKNKESSNLSTPRPKAGASPTFFTGNYRSKNNKDSNCDSYRSNKKDGLQTTVNNKKYMKKCKAVTPMNERKKNTIMNDCNDEKKDKKYSALYRNKDIDNSFNTEFNSKNQIYKKKQASHLSTDRKMNTISIIKKDSENLKIGTNIKKKEKNKIKFQCMTTKNSKNGKKKITYKKNNIRKKNIEAIHNLISLNTSTLLNKSKFDNLREKNVEIFTIFNNISNNNVQISEPQQESNKTFKNLISEKKVDIFLKNQNKSNKFIKEKDKRNTVKDTYTGYVFMKKKLGKIEKEIKADTHNIENIKLILLNILSESTNQQYDIIIKNELSQLKAEIIKNKNIINEINKFRNEKTEILKELNELKSENTKNINNLNELKTEKIHILEDLNNAKNENAEKGQKIIEKEEIIKKKEEENLEEKNKVLQLQNEYNNMQSENNNMKESLYLMERENKRMLGEIEKLKEDNQKIKKILDEKNKKNFEFKNLDSKSKKYQEEIKKSNYKLNINNLNLGAINQKTKRLSLTYNSKVEKLLKNMEKKITVEKKGSTDKKKSIQINNNDKIISNLVIPEEKKIKEDSQDKEEKDSVYSVKSNDDDNEDNKKNKKDNKNIIIKEEEKKNEEKKIIEIIKEENEKKIETPIINININNNINNNINSNKNEIEVNKINNNYTNNKNINTNTTADKKISKVSDTNNVVTLEKNISKNTTNEPMTERQKKMSKALNRFKKKMSQVPNASNIPIFFNPERSNSCIKKSDKIANIAKMLEKQIGLGKKEENNDERPVTDDESNSKVSNMIEIIERKPAGKSKKKPSMVMRFKMEE